MSKLRLTYYKGVPDVVTHEIRQIFLNKLYRIATQEFSWQKIKKHIQSSEDKDTEINDIRTALLFLPNKFVSQIHYVQKQLKATFDVNREEVQPFSEPPASPPPENKIKVLKIDKYCKTWIKWYVKGVVSECTVHALMSQVYQIFPTDYSLKYIVNEMDELIENWGKNKKKPKFSELKVRRKIKKEEQKPLPTKT